MSSNYQADLAYIHHTGFGDFSRVEALSPQRRGHRVQLYRGSALARELRRVGFK
ncbi:MAG: hypothetical protein AAB354_12405 [candidate division KSB1 bacterium]